MASDDSTHDHRLQQLKAIATAFDRHELDAIMDYFADDCVFLAPRGRDAVGTRIEGKAAVREAFAGRFAGLPDVRYTDDTHFVSGNRGASEWLLTGTTPAGERIEVRGCDLWTFGDDKHGDQDKIVLKDSYWKIRTT